MSRETNVAPRTMSRTVRDDSGLWSFKPYTCHLLNDKLMKIRRVRARKLLRKYGICEYRQILFTDEKSSNLPDFIKASDWTSGSPDLNPLDYTLWQKIESISCAKRHKTVDGLKNCIKKAVKNIPTASIRKAIDGLARTFTLLCHGKRGAF